MIAGAGLTIWRWSEHVVSEAPHAIARLTELGVPFCTENGELHLTREGGHSHRRIVHVADATGWAVQQALEKAAAANPNITLIPDMVAIDLITAAMPRIFQPAARSTASKRSIGATESVRYADRASAVLATGGADEPNLFSTAPRGATGDGIAMAWRAGCRVSNMEFHAVPPELAYIIWRSRTS
jgi:L-aspartate oxidase